MTAKVIKDYITDFLRLFNLMKLHNLSTLLDFRIVLKLLNLLNCQAGW